MPLFWVRVGAVSYTHLDVYKRQAEGNETVTNCHGLKMTASDGKKRLTDVADTEQLLRIIQSIPSPKAEPFKLWLAQVGRERIEETIDPELTIERALETYLKKGYTREWINQRLQAIQVRKELTDEWDARGVQKGVEYAIPVSYTHLDVYKRQAGYGRIPEACRDAYGSLSVPKGCNDAA